MPQNAVDRAAGYLEQGINGAANILEEMHALRPAITAEVAALLGMDNVPQTRRMACAIIANAMIFHERIAGMHEGIGALRSVCGPDVPDPQDRTLQAWADILAINYWPIFAIGKDILERLPSDTALQVLRRLRQTAASVNGIGVNNAHDLTGRVFQRLISDRKYLATFYTLPASAALLARLAVAKIRPPVIPATPVIPAQAGIQTPVSASAPSSTATTPVIPAQAGIQTPAHPAPPPAHPEPVEGRADSPEPGEGVPFNWADPAAIAGLRIGDFACGTGALLSAVYEQIAARHESAGGDAAAIHPAMMEEVLYGCDVMPSAIHITGSTLAGIQPDVMYGRSRLYTMPYGRQDDGTVKIGSLELLQSSQVMTLFNTSDPALRTGSAGEETAAQVNAEIPDWGFDLIIMNPPFTRATNHEGSHADVVNPAFAAFDASKSDMDDMGKRLNQLGRNSCYHGNAGIASAFAALAQRKLKPGGVLALVLPLSAAAGLSWQGFRAMLKADYTDLTRTEHRRRRQGYVLLIGYRHGGMSGNSPQDCKASVPPGERARFASLRRRPAGLAPAGAVAASIENGAYVRQIEEGPYGGTRLTVGDELSGEILNAPAGAGGEAWGSVRLSDYSLAQTAYALADSQTVAARQSRSHGVENCAFGSNRQLGDC